MGNPFAITRDVYGTLGRIAKELSGGGYLKRSEILPVSKELSFRFDTPISMTRITPAAQCWYKELSNGYLAMDVFCEFQITAGLTGMDFLYINSPILINPEPTNGSYPLWTSRLTAATMLNGVLIDSTGVPSPVSFVFDLKLGVFLEVLNSKSWANDTYQIYAGGLVRRV